MEKKRVGSGRGGKPGLKRYLKKKKRGEEKKTCAARSRKRGEGHLVGVIPGFVARRETTKGVVPGVPGKGLKKKTGEALSGSLHCSRTFVKKKIRCGR